MEKPNNSELKEWSRHPVTRWVIKQLEEEKIDKLCNQCHSYNDTCEQVALKRTHVEGYATGIDDVTEFIEELWK